MNHPAPLHPLEGLARLLSPSLSLCSLVLYHPSYLQPPHTALRGRADAPKEDGGNLCAPRCGLSMRTAQGGTSVPSVRLLSVPSAPLVCTSLARETLAPARRWQECPCFVHGHIELRIQSLALTTKSVELRLQGARNAVKTRQHTEKGNPSKRTFRNACSGNGNRHAKTETQKRQNVSCNTFRVQTKPTQIRGRLH